ncbi:MAG: phosphoribosylformylglycinamidine synthase I, partial [Spirochaetae bacterium HGW-Spirochaetae-8]
MDIRIAIIEFPGTNCERESAQAVRRAGMDALLFRWNMPVELLDACDGYLIAGGFSYEDRSRSGIIAALDPVLNILKTESARGKPVLGICNGAQILVEAGLVPGFHGYQVGMALAGNRRISHEVVAGSGFYNSWVDMVRTPAENPVETAFTRGLASGQRIHLPAAHAEGRFVIPNSLLELLHGRGMDLFRYRENPNGSTSDLAGVCNTHGNILALMPHPERTTAGDPLFQSMRDYIIQQRASGWTRDCQPDLAIPLAMQAQLEPQTIPQYHPLDSTLSKELIIGTIITDNSAVSVEQALKRLGLETNVQRHLHWEFNATDALTPRAFDTTIQQAEASGELYNPNKEFVTGLSLLANSQTYLVRPLPGEDSPGQHAIHTLSEWFGVEGLANV